jgi:hypothetical protein
MSEKTDELATALEKIKELEEQLKPKAAPAPVVEMKGFDIWQGNLVVLKQKKHLATGQSYVTKMQFQFTGSKPKKSVTVPQKVADFWNDTHFTARFQSTDLLFPAGVKKDIYWDLDEENEAWIRTEKELETA